VPRHGYAVLWDGKPSGLVTSGTHSPTLGKPIAMAYLDAEAAEEAQQAADRGAEAGGRDRLAIDIRGSAEPAALISLPFYRREPKA
jgi:aminomethyltransferase